MTMGPIAIHWFRRDLRLADNPALSRAAEAGRVLAVFIHDPAQPDEVAPGAAGRVWLDRALGVLDAALGGRLNILRGQPESLLPALALRHRAARVTWSALPDPALAAVDARVCQALQMAGVEAIREHSFLLWEPAKLRKPDGAPYKVFTPFWRHACLAAPPPRRPLPQPRFDVIADDRRLPRAALGLVPRLRWAEAMIGHWQVGEQAAQARLAAFVARDLARYPQSRDMPAAEATSRLSPHLHFGEISPAQAWAAARGPGANKLRSELGWREFSWNLLMHEPALADAPLRPEFARMAWRHAPDDISAWQQGRTGIPFVDAGMRELWQTGWMHNRVRMVTASFLVKNLLVDWREGERWFRDTLIDADPGNNAANWQWVAGCGADAAPFFRIFNPVLQGRKFDPKGAYVRRFLPELSRLPDRWIHAPWEAPEEVRAAAGVHLGKSYPRPIVDLAASRRRALDAFAALKPG